MNVNQEVIHKWKIIPSENGDDPPTILVWDNESKQWLPDQDQNGIPDIPNTIGDTDSMSTPEPPLGGSGGTGGGGGGGGHKIS